MARHSVPGDLTPLLRTVLPRSRASRRESLGPAPWPAAIKVGRHPTGYWAEEFVAPYSAFTKAGHEVTVATPGAVVPTVDMTSLRPDMAGSAQKAREEEDVIERADELRWPIAVTDVHLQDYDAVYYPGGHGPMQDLVFEADSGKLLVEALASGKPLAVVCHAPAALLATRNLYTGQNPASAGPLAQEPLKVLK